MKRPANQKQRHIEISDRVLESLEILANPGALKRLEPLRGDPQFVAYRKTDSLFSDVERKNSAFPLLLFRSFHVWIINRMLE